MRRSARRCPLWIAHCVGMRLIALALAQARIGMAACAFLIVLAAMLVGCASLPDSLPNRPPLPSPAARADASATRLAAVADASLNAGAGAGAASGLRLLPAGDQAFEARIALIRAAQKTIDAQYYQIADDASGRQFLRELGDAAARGVQVRLLVDDLQAGGEDALLGSLAAEPNVALRMFNPLPVRGRRVGTRLLLSLNDFQRINRRMHNKLLVVDASFAISGGRNIADAYFDRSQPGNFFDMDLLSAGPVVAELAGVFDSYWNSELAWPIQRLVQRGLDAAPRGAGHAAPPGLPAAAPLDALGQGSVGAQLAGGFVALHMAEVRVLADAPRLPDSGDAAPVDSAVMNGNLALLQSARSEVIVASPYFLPGRRTLDILQQAADSHVRVSLLTNSLATTDEPLVHHGYAGYRLALLQMGVALFEWMPDDEDLPSAATGAQGSTSRLHAKLAVVDRRWLSIGSMNMDPRSAHCNTELGLIVDSPDLARQVAHLLQDEQQPRRYEVRRADHRPGLQWVSRGGAQPVVRLTEPNSNWRLRLRLSLLSTLVDEELL